MLKARKEAFTSLFDIIKSDHLQCSVQSDLNVPIDTYFGEATDYHSSADQNNFSGSVLRDIYMEMEFFCSIQHSHAFSANSVPQLLLSSNCPAWQDFCHKLASVHTSFCIDLLQLVVRCSASFTYAYGSFHGHGNDNVYIGTSIRYLMMRIKLEKCGLVTGHKSPSFHVMTLC